MKTIKLRNGEITKIDDKDFALVNQWTWNCLIRKSGTKAVVRCEFVNGRSRTIYLHRFLLNAPKGVHVDHKNGDTLDNQRHNIRLCNQAQNNRNTRKHKDSISKFKGVYWDKTNKKWRCRITVDKKTIELGRFKNEIEAAKTYDNAAKKYFQEFAFLNLP